MSVVIVGGDGGKPNRSGRRCDLNAGRSLQERVVSTVAAGAAMIIRPTVLMRVGFEDRRRLQCAETDQHQQDEQEPR